MQDHHTSALLVAYAGVGCSLTMACAVLVVLTYWRNPALRRHPYNLVYHRSMCDLGFAVVLLAQVVQGHRGLLSRHCVDWATALHGLSVASQMWFLVAMVDLLYCYLHPFYETHAWRYQVGVYGTSVVATVATRSFQAFGKNSLDICWMGDQDHSVDQSTWWALFFAPSLVTLTTSISACVFVFAKLNNTTTASELSSSTRKRTLEISRVFAVCFTVHWIALVVLYGVGLGSDKTPPHVAGWTLFLWGARGVVSGVVWLHTDVCRCWWKLMWETSVDVEAENRKALVEETQLDVSFQQALREDIMHATSQSILHSAARQGAQLCSHFMLPPDFAEKQIERRVWTNKTTGQRGVVRFAFYDFAPKVFYSIRCRWGLGSLNYMQSFGKFHAGSWVAHNLIENSSGGRSGAFFYFSQDRRFVIKTMSRAENKALRRMLPNYHKFVMDNPDTLISHFYGCHAIKIHFRKFYFAVMDNVFPLHRVHEVYDLKGSWVNRNVGAAGRGTLKDSDFHRRNRRVFLSQNTTDALMDQLRLDANFLAGCGIMDYSLLLGIHNSSDGMQMEAHGRSLVNPAAIQEEKEGEEDGQEEGEGEEEEEEEEEGEAEEEGVEDEMDALEPEALQGVDPSRRLVHPALSKPRSTRGMPVHSLPALRHIRPRKLVAGKASRVRLTRSPASRASLLQPTTPYVPFHRVNDLGLFSGDQGSRWAGHGSGFIYYFGIIDVLQEWTLQKRLERRLKALWLGTDKKHGISVVSPAKYAVRFVSRMEDIFSGHSSHSPPV